MEKENNRGRIVINIPPGDFGIKEKLSEEAKEQYQSVSRTAYMIIKEYFDAQKRAG